MEILPLLFIVGVFYLVVRARKKRRQRLAAMSPQQRKRERKLRVNDELFF